MIGGSLPLVRALRDRLIERLPAALAAQVAHEGGDVLLDPPRTYRLYITPDEQDYPVVFVVPGSASPQEDTGRWVTRLQEVLVVAMLRADTQEHLATALQLYEAALIDALLAQHAPPPAHALAWTGTSPGPIFNPTGQDQSSVWQSWVELTFGLIVYEEDRTA